MTGGGRVVELYRNEYHAQSQGNELISNASALFNPDVFSPVAMTLRRLPAPFPADPVFDVNQVTLQDSAGREWIAEYSYLVGGRHYVSPRITQLATAWQALYAHPTAGVIAVAMPCVPDCDSVVPILEQVLSTADAAYRNARREH